MDKKAKKIKCSLREFTKWHDLFPTDETEKTKKGFYHGSYFWNVPRFGMDKWVIAAHIVDVNIDSLLEEGLTENQIVDSCIEHLNILPKRKKYAKKKPKRPYGNLEVLRSSIKEEHGKKYISVLLTTDERKNKAFWGEGKKVNRVRKWGNKK